MRFTPLVTSVTRWLREEGGTSRELAQRLDFLDGSSPDTVAFWMAWAEQVIAMHGLSRPTSPPLSLGDYLSPGDGFARWMAQRLAFVKELGVLASQVPLDSAEWFASQLLSESMCPSNDLDAFAPMTGRQNRIAALIVQMHMTISQGHVEQLKPLADLGRRVRKGGTDGARKRNAERGPGRRGEVPAWEAWLRKLSVAPKSRHGAARRISQHFGVPFETVRKYLPKKAR